MLRTANEKLETVDCNRCDPNFKCEGANTILAKCKSFRPPYDKFKLLELALEHPQSLIETEQFLRNCRPRLTMRIQDYL